MLTVEKCAQKVGQHTRQNEPECIHFDTTQWNGNDVAHLFVLATQLLQRVSVTARLIRHSLCKSDRTIFEPASRTQSQSRELCSPSSDIHTSESRRSQDNFSCTKIASVNEARYERNQFVVSACQHSNLLCLTKSSALLLERLQLVFALLSALSTLALFSRAPHRIVTRCRFRAETTQQAKMRAQN